MLAAERLTPFGRREAALRNRTMAKPTHRCDPPDRSGRLPFLTWSARSISARPYVSCAGFLAALGCSDPGDVRLAVSCLIPTDEALPVVIVRIDPEQAARPGFLRVVSHPLDSATPEPRSVTPGRTEEVKAVLFAGRRPIESCSVEGSPGVRAVSLDVPRTVFRDPHVEVRARSAVRIAIIEGSTEIVSRVLDPRESERIVLQWPEPGRD